MNEQKALILGVLLLISGSVISWHHHHDLQPIAAVPKAFQGEWVSISDLSQWPRLMISDRGMFFMQATRSSRSSHLVDHDQILSDSARRVLIGDYLVELQTNRVISVSQVDRSGGERRPVLLGTYTLDGRIDYETGITTRVLEPR